MDISLIKTLDNSKARDVVLARWVSHIVSPHWLAIVLTSSITLNYSNDPFTTLFWLWLIVPAMAVPPIAYILWLVHIGYLEDFYMPNRANRLRPISVTVLWLAFGLALLRYFEVPFLVQIIASTIVLLISLLGLITLFWKISFHAASVSAATVTLVMVLGWHTGPSLLLIPLVGWSRVRLKRHTTQQVIAGSVAGLIIAVLMVKYALLPSLLATP
jgi:membrane-associated phospholipid phosphatase